MQMIRTIRALAITAVLALAGPALAQSSAIPLDQLKPAHVAAAKEVVILSGINRTFNAFVPAIAQRIFDMVTPTRPELRTDLDAVLKAMVPEYEKRNEEMIDHTAKLFASVMTEADLKATAAFFKSAAGKKYVEMQPRVIDQMVLAVDEWNRKLTEEMLQRARAEMKKKGKDM